ncbi:MAG: molecular chaperone DnaJ [Planctomycetota bacterium]|jgi:molecular chaperone DnaJ
MSDKRDYYEVLGVPKDAEATAIKKAYRKLAMKHHPDRNPDDAGAESKFKEAAEAYDVLGDQEKRGQYDRFGHQAFSPGGQYGGGGFSNMDDIFSAFGDIFSGGGGGGGGGGIFDNIFGGGGGGRRRSGPRRGRDLKVVLDLTLEEIDTGVSKTLSINRVEHCDPCSGKGAKPGTGRKTCSTCGGRGQVAQKAGFFTMAQTCPTCQGAGESLEDPCSECNGSGGLRAQADVEIAIPAGIEEGVRLRVSGEGDAGPPGGSRGDLYVLVREVEHKIFQRSGPDVLTEVPFSFSQLALGDKVEIPTLRGKLEMTVPAGTQSGKVFRLRAQGLPRMEGRGRGDQLVRVFVQIPTKLTERQEELLREFGELENSSKGSKSFFERIADHFSS